MTDSSSRATAGSFEDFNLIWISELALRPLLQREKQIRKDERIVLQPPLSQVTKTHQIRDKSFLTSLYTTHLDQRALGLSNESQHVRVHVSFEQLSPFQLVRSLLHPRLRPFSTQHMSRTGEPKIFKASCAIYSAINGFQKNKKTKKKGYTVADNIDPMSRSPRPGKIYC